MHRKLASSLVSLLLVGWLSAGCGEEPQPPPPPDTSPVLTGPTAGASEALSGDTVSLTVEATSPTGDALTYAWTQLPASPAGTFSSTSVASPTWTAPKVAENTAFQLKVTVTNSQGEQREASVTVQVRPPPNRAPVLTAPASASSASVSGSTLVQLSVAAEDPDGNPLTYAWTQEPASPAGTFNDASVARPTWTSPVVSSAQRFTLKVTISDGKGGTVRSQVDVDVAPPAPQNHAPVLTAGPLASASYVKMQGSVTLSASASDEDSDTLTWLWTQEPASPAGTFSSTSEAAPTWTAPQVTTETPFQLRVTVTDGQGGSVSQPVTVQVLAPVSGSTNTVTSRGCTFTLATETQPGSMPPVYQYVVRREASASCPYPAGSRNLSTSYTTGAAITGNWLGIAVAYSLKNTPSGSSPYSISLHHLDPATLETVRQGGLSCGPTYSSVFLGDMFMPDGTTVQVDGSKGCSPLYGGDETSTGSSFHAYYYDFFTSTDRPVIVAY